MSNELATINFHGDEILAYQDPDTGKVFVNVRSICDALGLNFSGQYTKLTSDSAYSGGLAYMDIQTSFGMKSSLFLDKELLQGWLFSIQTKRLKLEVRDKHVQFKSEAIKALNDHFTQGFSINERALEQMPDVVLDGIAARLSARLAPTVSKTQLVLDRMEALEAIFKTLGRPDDMVVATLQNQCVADLMGQAPAPTLQEQDRWYASEFWQEKRREGYRNVYFSDTDALVNVLGRYASQASRKNNLTIYKVTQINKSGRTMSVGQYKSEALEIALSRLHTEGKVIDERGLSDAKE